MAKSSSPFSIPLSFIGNFLGFPEIDAQIAKLSLQVNEYGYDPFGMNVRDARPLLAFATALYKHYFRVETTGIENVPAGRIMLVSNHAGQIPMDGMMIGMAMFWQAHPPRVVRGMVDRFVPDLPVAGTLLSRCGQIVGLPANCKRLLARNETILVFPEGTRGISKPILQAYQLTRFGTGFARLALETDTLVVPVGVIGSEEQNLSLFNSRFLSQLFGVPTFPVSPTGFIPLPSRYHIYFGEPMKLAGTAQEDDEHIIKQVDRVKKAIHGLLQKGLKERTGVYL